MGESVSGRRCDDGVQQLEGQARVHLDVEGKRADPAGQVHGAQPVPDEHRRGELPERSRMPPGTAAAAPFPRSALGAEASTPHSMVEHFTITNRVSS
jgi:hypothetical protein